MIPVTLMGDSLTWRGGYSDLVQATIPGTRVAAQGGFPTAIWLPTGMWYKRDQFSFDPPGKVSILLGGNDAATGVTAADYKANIRTIVDALLDDGVGEVILVAPPQSFGQPSGWNTLILAYRDELCDVADEQVGPSVTFGPDLTTMDQSLFLLDGVHFNTEGNQHVHDVLVPFLQ